MIVGIATRFTHVFLMFFHDGLLQISIALWRIAR